MKTEAYIDSAAELFNIKAGENLFRGNKQNTTIACIITNGNFTCAQMNKIAAMARGAVSELYTSGPEPWQTVTVFMPYAAARFMPI